MIRIRKTNVVVGAAVAVGCLFMIYLVLDTLSLQGDESELQKVSVTGPMSVQLG